MGAYEITDELDLLEQQGRARRAEVKAARKTPEAKAKKNYGRSQRNRGLRCERKLAKELEPWGFRRVPLSGAVGSGKKDDPWSGDLRRTHGVVRSIEVKRRFSALKQLRAWLAQGSVDAVIVDVGGGEEPVVSMRLSVFKRMLEAR